MIFVDAAHADVAFNDESTQDVDHIHSLTAATASGDPEAFARLYKAKFNFVLRVVRKTTGYDEQTSLDMVQDVMLRVIRSMKPFQDEQALDAWLACMARHVAFDYVKRDRRRRMRELASMNGRYVDEVENIEALNEKVAWIRRELSGLDRVSAGMIELRFYTGLTLKAIGERLGLSTGAVHRRILSSIKQLRLRMKEEDDE